MIPPVLGDAAYLITELVALFFGIAFAIELLQRRVGTDRLQAWMGGSPVVAALKGITVGFVTPFCTFSAIPMLIGFRRARVRAAGSVAFIVAAPILDPVLFGAFFLIAGLRAAIVYAVVAFAAAMVLALAADRVGIDRFLKPIAAIQSEPTRQTIVAGVPARGPAPTVGHEDQAEGCTVTGCGEGSTAPWRGWRSESRLAARSATKLLRSVALMLAVGVSIGIAINTFVSPETAATLTGDNSFWSIPIAALLGTPLYLSTELFVPIADALTDTGVGIGAVVALTIAGAGASLPEFFLLTKLAHTKILAVFFGLVLVIATVGGLLTEAIAG